MEFQWCLIWFFPLNTSACKYSCIVLTIISEVILFDVVDKMSELNGLPGNVVFKVRTLEKRSLCLPRGWGKAYSGVLLPLGSGSGSAAGLRPGGFSEGKHGRWRFLGAASSEFYFHTKHEPNGNALSVDFSTALRVTQPWPIQWSSVHSQLGKVQVCRQLRAAVSQLSRLVSSNQLQSVGAGCRSSLRCCPMSTGDWSRTSTDPELAALSPLCKMAQDLRIQHPVLLCCGFIVLHSAVFFTDEQFVEILHQHHFPAAFAHFMFLSCFDNSWKCSYFYIIIFIMKSVIFDVTIVIVWHILIVKYFQLRHWFFLRHNAIPHLID